MALTLANVKLSGGDGGRSAATLEAGHAPFHRNGWPIKEPMRTGVCAVLLSVDGVMVDTRAYKVAAWQQLAEDLQFPYDPAVGASLPGLPMMDALDSLLGSAAKDIGPVEKEIFLDRQQFYYRRLLATLTPADVVHGGRIFAAHVRATGVKLAGLVPAMSGGVGGKDLLSLLDLGEAFDGVFDGEAIDELALDVAATSMGSTQRGTIVITGCERTVKSAKRAGMRSVGIASHMSPYFVPDAIAPNLAAVRMDQLDSLVGAVHPPAA